MNSDEEPKPVGQLDALAMIRNVVNKLGPTVSEAADSFKTLGRMQEPKKKKSGTKNKSQKRNKKRYLMAKKSNRINRQRIKGWKY